MNLMYNAKNNNTIVEVFMDNQYGDWYIFIQKKQSETRSLINICYMYDTCMDK